MIPRMGNGNGNGDGALGIPDPIWWVIGGTAATIAAYQLLGRKMLRKSVV